MEFYATCFRGVEPMLAEELAGLGCRVTGGDRETVRFVAGEEDVWRVHLLSRLANKVVLVLDEREVGSGEDLYRQAMSVDWPRWFDVDRRFAVEAAVALSSVGPADFCGLKVKDGVADRFRREVGRRPDVDREAPDVFVDLRVVRNRSTLGLNLSGERLFRRGYRVSAGAAPVKETLAAAVMEIVRPEGYGRFVDPMAGSGTLVVEAVWRVLGWAAGRLRSSFAFEALRGFDAERYARLRRQVLGAVSKTAVGTVFECSDISEEAVRRCRRNLEAAGLSGAVAVVRRDFFGFVPGEPAGVAVFNPPYGLRLKGDDLGGFYRRIGDTLKRNWRGWTVWLFTEKAEHLKRVGLRSSRRVELYNGGVECRLVCFRMY